MKKRTLIGIVSAGILLLGIAGSSGNESTPADPISQAVQSTAAAEEVQPTVQPICDGITTTSDCTADGVEYKTYIYHEPIPEKSHSETITTYKEEVTGYCTLCNDGTYSPSCAKGRGACSHHGGVAQWNAPRYSNTPVYTTNTIIDAPAQAAYFDKIPG